MSVDRRVVKTLPPTLRLMISLPEWEGEKPKGDEAEGDRDGGVEAGDEVLEEEAEGDEEDGGMGKVVAVMVMGGTLV